jgi:sugar phosphate isomerase/epimerase
MKLGAYTAVLHDKPLPILRGMGLESAEINSGGSLPAPHLPIADIRASAGAREDYLGQFTEAGMTLTALNCNGNPLHPDPEVREKHAQDLRDAIELGALLGGRDTMSRWPEDSSWDFVAVGRGHDVGFWAEFLAALEKVDPDMAVNIEHEDQELDQLEGPRYAAAPLLEASGRSEKSMTRGGR